MYAGRAARRRRPGESHAFLFSLSPSHSLALPVPHGMRNWLLFTTVFSFYLGFPHALPHPWMFDVGMYEPLHLTFDAYPSVVPPVRVRGVMALFLAVSILWALIW